MSGEGGEVGRKRGQRLEEARIDMRDEADEVEADDDQGWMGLEIKRS